jgi:hypothetical protein
MINTDTPYKLRDIIQDTWPNLYYLKKDDWKPGTRGERNDAEEVPEC